MTGQRLAHVGIHTLDELKATGAVPAFKALKFHFGKDVTLSALYALEAAVRGIDWQQLDDTEKARLKREAGLG
ncbi:MAG: TfoX/Sxy family DNA transformation protein [Devosia sp.]